MALAAVLKCERVPGLRPTVHLVVEQTEAHREKGTCSRSPIWSLTKPAKLPQGPWGSPALAPVFMRTVPMSPLMVGSKNTGKVSSEGAELVECLSPLHGLLMEAVPGVLRICALHLLPNLVC